MSFSVEQALQICTAKLRERAKSRTNSYTLLCSNDGKRIERTIHGFSMAQLKEEFTALGSSYKWAFITKKGETKVEQFFNRDMCKRNKKGVYMFFSMNKGKKRS